ncbi:hypothetical protein JT358_08480 [Micrococcales bacterium 31B]|nr:hypothetical protein [Micrococcales bacterium 31B]
MTFSPRPPAWLPAPLRALLPVAVYVIVLAIMVGLIAFKLGPGEETPSKSTAANPVVLVGFTGVSWADVNANSTPNLYKFLANANMGAMLVRTSSRANTAKDGWTSLGAGSIRAGYIKPDTLNAFTLMTISNGLKSHTYGALAPFALSVTNSTTELPAGEGALQRAIVSDLTEHTDVVVVDAGRLDVATSPGRGGDAAAAPREGYSSLAAIDAYVGQVVQAAHVAAPQAMVIAASLADDGQPNELRFLASQSAINQPPGLLNSLNTRQAGLAMVSDILPTIANHLKATLPPGYRPGMFVSHEMPFTEAAQSALDRTLAANAIEPGVQKAKFFVPMGILFVLCVLPTFIAIFTQRRAWPLGIAFALSLPVSTYLAMLVPWYRSDTPLLVLSVVTCAIAAGIAILAVTVGRTAFGIGGIVGLTTAVVIYADVATGSTLQISAPLGEPATSGARWYGMGNMRFGLALSGIVMFIGWQFSRLPGKSARNRVRRTLLAAGIGLVCIVLGVSPLWGSDLGGLFGSVPAFMTLLFVATNLRISLRRMLLVVGAMALVIVGVCVIDWLRPPESRTHFGDLVDRVVSGEFFDLLFAVLSINMSTLFAGANWILPLLFAAGGWWLIRGWRRYALFTYEPALRGTLLAIFLGGSLAFIANDSGTSLISAVVCMVVPVVLLAIDAQRGADLRFAESRIERMRNDL